MTELLRLSNWIAGVQWLFFIFTNIVVIPITVGTAFQLEGKIVMLLQYSFIATGIACMMQAILGHKRAILEGQSGLWWGVILSLCYTVSQQGITLETVAGSLAIGIVLSGLLTILLGVSGLGSYISKWFNDGVMAVFMLLFGFQIMTIFFKGMLGIPFQANAEEAPIHVPVFLLSSFLVIFVIIISLKTPPWLARYALLIGICVGWLLYTVFISSESGLEMNGYAFELFPLGDPVWNTGIILTAVITGLLNTANTFGALKGTDDLYSRTTTPKQYKRSFTITGFFVMGAGVLGLVPYAPYVSSIGFLKQTQIIDRIPYILGGFMFMLMGIFPVFGEFFSKLPLSVGSAILFVAYLQLLNSSMQFFKKMDLHTRNIYRSAIPVFIGVIIMTMPVSAFALIPSYIRPLVSNGLLVGIILALLLENIFRWEDRPSSETNS